MKSITKVLLGVALFVATAFAGNDTGTTYLALGDSIPFGMNITLLPPYASSLPTAADFVGYPEVVTAVLRFSTTTNEVNASCPGESSGSFLDVKNPDYGYNSPHPQPPFPPIKGSPIGLHVTYQPMESQMAFAEAQLKSNKHINLVTLNIGANDLYLVLPQLLGCGTDQACAQGVLAPVLQAYATNLTEILMRIRALYQGKLILMTYYSPAPQFDGFTIALNTTMTQVAAKVSAMPHTADITIVDGFAAFQLASAFAGHDACKAGLLIKLPFPPETPCDIHPSQLGRDILAAIVLWNNH
jgi:lysophospholipase L1-like esterase